MRISLDTDFIEIDDTLSGRGILSNPLKVAEPGITEVIVDGTLKGSGIEGDPLSVATVGIAGIILKTQDEQTIINNVVEIKVSNGSLVNDGEGVATFTPSGGGGGGSPGGLDGNVQFNKSNTFAGDKSFSFNKAYPQYQNKPAIILDDGSMLGSDGAVITGGTSGIQLGTDNSLSDNLSSGWVQLFAGDNYGSGGTAGSIFTFSGDAINPDSTPGDVFIKAGDCGNINLGDGNNHGGHVDIVAGSTGNTAGGHLNLSSGSSAHGAGGGIRFTLGGGNTFPSFRITQNAAVTTQPNVAIGSTVSFGGGQGVIYIHNRTIAPTTNPAQGGILYIENGALMYKGSSGTVTIVAPA